MQTRSQLHTDSSSGGPSNRRTRSKLAAAIALGTLLAAAAFPVASFAEYVESDGPLKRHVPYGDLDLSAPEDVSELYDRVRDAAREVCEPYRSRFPARWPRCYKTAIKEAVVRLDHEAVTALHRAQQG